MYSSTTCPPGVRPRADSRPGNENRLQASASRPHERPSALQALLGGDDAKTLQRVLSISRSSPISTEEGRLADANAARGRRLRGRCSCQHSNPWIKGTRSAIRRRASNLRPQDQSVLDDLTETNLDLYRGWLLLEQLRGVYQARDHDEAMRLLDAWIYAACVSELASCIASQPELANPHPR